MFKFFKDGNETPKDNVVSQPQYDFWGQGLTQLVTFGRNTEYETAAVVLNRSEDNLHKVIVNHDGYFEDFPGIIDGKWSKHLKSPIDSFLGKICFRTSFEHLENGYRCFWEIQPDGRYWADSDGYGAENDLEIVLYSDMDKNGNFISPFRVYSVDGVRADENSDNK